MEHGLNSSHSLSNHHTSQWTVLQNGLIDSAILHEFFSSVSKCLAAIEEKQS